MGWLDRVEDQVDALTKARALQEVSRSTEAYGLLEQVLRATSDPHARADALVQRLSALINLGRTAEYTRAIEEASAAVRDLAEPYLHGHLNALAALAAHHQGALDRCVTHLVKAARALGAVEEADRDTAWGWHDLAMAYSYLSFHGYALGAIERARQLGTAAGIPEETFAAPGIRLRNAVALDHTGDSDGCLRVLRDVGGDLGRFVTAGRADRLRPSSPYGYAAPAVRPRRRHRPGPGPGPGPAARLRRGQCPGPRHAPARPGVSRHRQRTPHRGGHPAGHRPRVRGDARRGRAARLRSMAGWPSGSPRSATTGSVTSTSTASPPGSTTRRCAVRRPGSRGRR